MLGSYPQMRVDGELLFCSRNDWGNDDIFFGFQNSNQIGKGFLWAIFACGIPKRVLTDSKIASRESYQSAMSTHSNYLYRMTTVFALTSIAPVVDAEVLKDYILPTAATFANDSIPNIRFNVAKGYQVMLPLMKQFGLEVKDAQVVLQKLVQDTDADVRYFASISVQ